MATCSREIDEFSHGSDDAGIPAFHPHRWLRGAHVQTIAGRYWPSVPSRLEATSHEVVLPDGDRLLVLDSIPRGWERSRPSAVLVHGLASCALAPYVVRLGWRLVRMGIRVVRVNLRGAGSGFGLARRLYHAGRSDDLRAVLDWLSRQSGQSPVALVGFSLGANLALKLAAEAALDSVPGLDCVLAANPPVDLAACARRLQRVENRLYDWCFVRCLTGTVHKLHRLFPELGPTNIDGVRSVIEFDDRYTAPRNGFASADDYYERCSLLTALQRIAVPGLVVHALDDPFIPGEPFRGVNPPPHLAVELVQRGGHLGYISSSRWEGDHRWLDARLAAWLKSHWRIPRLDAGAVSGRGGAA
jgi:predicted alpha/beta-fold hydrolase